MCVCVRVRGALLLVVLLLSAARIGAKFHRRPCAHADRSLQAGRPAMLGERRKRREGPGPGPGRAGLGWAGR